MTDSTAVHQSEIRSDTAPHHVINIDSMRLTIQQDDTVLLNGLHVHLSPSKTRLLLILAGDAGKVVTKGTIMERLYPDGTARPEPKIMEVFVCKLRGALNDVVPGAEHIIETVWGRGYCLRDDSVTAEMSLEKLPPRNARWVASRKERVLQCLRAGTVTLQQVYDHYPDLSPEELSSWRARYNRSGRKALCVYRELERSY